MKKIFYYDNKNIISAQQKIQRTTRDFSKQSGGKIADDEC